MTATSSRPVGVFRPPPIRPIDFAGTSRKAARRSTHWSRSCRRCTSTSVLTLRCAISQAATTVLPNAVVADNTPVSCFNIASAANICQAAARETDVMRIFLCAADNAWLVVCWQPHRLRLVELWILECRDTQQPVSQPWRQSVLGDVDLIAEDELKRLREVTSNRQLLSAS